MNRLEVLWIQIAPAVFVVFWSTGFIGAKYGLPNAEPLTFLAIRFLLAGGILAVVAVLFRSPWPATWRDAGHYAVVGLLIQGVYLGAVFYAIWLGVEAGVSSLIVSLQPLVVAALAGLVLGERVTRLQWLGLVLGFAGVTLVVWQKLQLGLGTPAGIALVVFGLAGISAGTLYQKRFGQGMNMVTGNLIQFAAGAAVMLVLAFALETREVNWTPAFAFTMAWLVVVLSLGTFTLLYLMIRRGAASRVASLFFLVPASTATIAYFMFGETFGPLSILGIIVSTTGVALANTRPKEIANP